MLTTLGESVSPLLCGSADLSEVELQWVVCGEGDIQASAEVFGQRVTMVVQEQRVVAQGGHCDTDLWAEQTSILLSCFIFQLTDTCF